MNDNWIPILTDTDKDVVAKAEAQYERARITAGLRHTPEERAFAVGFLAGWLHGGATAKKIIQGFLTTIEQEKPQ